jgi:hypothetical protein
MNEEWRDIKGYENRYQISNHGRVKSLRNNKGKYRELILNPSIWKDGYLVVTLNKKHKPVHRMVMETFKPNKDDFKSMSYENRRLVDRSKLQINHRDENVTNNNIDNLEWCTSTYKNCYGSRLNTISKKVLQYDSDLNLINEYPSTREAARQNNIDPRRIGDCCLGRKQSYNNYYWKYKEE